MVKATRSVSGQLVIQHVRVSGHDRVADLDSTALSVVRGADEPEHRYARHQRQQPHFSLGRHPCRDLLGEPLQRVAQFFQAGIDAARARVRVRDRSIPRYVRRDVRCGRFDRRPVEGLSPATDDYRSGMTEASAYLGWRFHFVDADHVDVRSCTGLFRFGNECRLAFLAVAPRETI